MNSDDYGIYAAGSSVSAGGLASARPLIDTEAVFWVFRPAAWISLDQIETVRVSYGSLPDNQIFVTNVPEPSTLALSLVAGVVMWRRQRAAQSRPGGGGEVLRRWRGFSKSVRDQRFSL